MGTLSQSLFGQKVYIDVNVFIYLLEGVEPWASSVQKMLMGMEAGNWQAVTSELSLAESLVKPFQLDREDLAQLYKEALSPRDHFSLAPVDSATLISAARLRALHGFKLPDAIHAATALTQGCTAFLTNDAGFRRTPGIQCVLLPDWIDKK
ncbi:MAG: type II toxin-antitoxin system VapC family toxin [Hydrogenophaga sp.]|uniref:type II toxin-antitoxin system VapC family toxin n=1 Tax=Hydrogenophaga sp. TaxID=1904254 RepID=UPI002ABA4141|nr:type II toxin-antitoxin system VapC family toxin [Hydrogenophaga sp.]MDZ4187959.1 type II toxin-antitoxin system VapC family toxin [Hydrogenophaga sp.]